MSLYGIYKITNITNDKIYIGSSSDLEKREYAHFYLLENNKHVNIHLQRAFNKSGRVNFKFEIVEILANLSNDKREMRNMLLEREQCWLDNLKPFGEVGYNLLPTAGSNLGYKFSEESKKKRGEARRGENHWTANKEFSEEHKLKLSESNKTSIPILQFTLNGELVKRWDNGQYQASKVLNLSQSGIWHCLNKKRNTLGGFIWIYETEYHKHGINLKDYVQKNKKEVIQTDLDGNFIRKWESVAEIERVLGIGNPQISRVCRKERKQAKGYKWFYVDDYNLISN